MGNLRKADHNVRLASEAIVELTKLSQIPISGREDAPDILDGRPLREALLKAALRYNERLLGDDSGDESIRADAHHRVGLIVRQVGEKEVSLRAYRDALAIREALARSAPEDEARQRDLAETLAGAGTLLAETGSLAEAGELLKRSRAIRDRAATDRPEDARAQGELAEVLQGFGEVLELARDRPQARESFEKALAIRERLAGRPDAPPWSGLDLARCLNRVALWYAENGESGRSKVHYARAISILAGVAETHPSYHLMLAERARSHHDFSFELRKGDTAEAMESARKALDLRRRLVAEHPAVMEFQRDLAASHYLIAELDQEAGRPAAALAAFEQCRAIQGRLVGRNPLVSEWRCLLALAQMRIGSLEQLDGRPERALSTASGALETLRPAAEPVQATPRLRRAWSVLLNNFGNLHANAGRLPEAIHFYEQGCEVDEALARAHRAETGREDRQDRQDRIIGRINLGTLQGKLRRRAEASRSIALARSLLEQGAGEDPLDAFLLACLESQLSVLIGPEGAASPDEEARREAHASRAVAELRRAVARGFRNVQAIRSEVALQPLADRDEFLELLRDLGFPEWPFAEAR